METSWRETHEALNSSLNHASISLIEDRLTHLLSGMDFDLKGIPDDFEAVESMAKALIPTGEITLKFIPSRSIWTALIIDEEGSFTGQSSGDEAALALLGAAVCVMAELEEKDALEGRTAA